jgi:hypothetical protein
MAGCVLASGPTVAFEATNAVWERFTLDQGQRAGVTLRFVRPPQFAPNLTAMVGLNYENAQTASAVRGAWMEAGRIGGFSAGPMVARERVLALSNRRQAPGVEPDLRMGAFLAYSEAGEEVGRLSLTTGRFGGVDLRMTRSFKLNDTVSLDVGPVLSLGSFERFGYDQIARRVSAQGVNVDRAQLGAFGLAGAIEQRLGDRTVARMFAEYARIEAQRGATPGLGSRDRFDLGVSITTQIGQ